MLELISVLPHSFFGSCVEDMLKMAEDLTFFWKFRVFYVESTYIYLTKRF